MNWVRFMWGQRSGRLRLYGVIFRWRIMLAVGVRDADEPTVKRTCTCVGHCRGAKGLGKNWECALESSA